MTENVKTAFNALNGLSGIYCFKCLVTGAMYIGSSVNLGDRLRDHILASSNIHLRNAIAKYGLVPGTAVPPSSSMINRR
jgi:hypothetical protein